MPAIHALLAVTTRNLKIGLRSPDLIIQSMLVPLVVLTLASIIFGASDAWPIAVTDRSQTPASRQLIQALKDTRGATGPYFRIVEHQPERAETLVRQGRLQLALTVPADFDQRRTIETFTYNINTDTMKNVRLRLVNTANIYDDRQGAQQVHLMMTKARPVDVTRNAFMGGGAVMLALMLGSTLIAANLFALDEEGRTTKEIVLSPLGAPLAALGAALAAFPLACLITLPTALLAYSFGLRVGLVPLLRGAVIILPAMLALSGLGVLAAQLLRTHRAIQPVVILTALGTYFAAGGFISVPALPPAARAFAAVWPPSYVFEWANPLIHQFSATLPLERLGWLAGAALLGLLAAYRAGQREIRHASRGGQ